MSAVVELATLNEFEGGNAERRPFVMRMRHPFLVLQATAVLVLGTVAVLAAPLEEIIVTNDFTLPTNTTQSARLVVRASTGPAPGRTRPRTAAGSRKKGSAS